MLSWSAAWVFALVVRVSNKMNVSENIAPAHELSHVIQNGVMYFKTRWFTEGRARRAEHALGDDGCVLERS